VWFGFVWREGDVPMMEDDEQVLVSCRRFDRETTGQKLKKIGHIGTRGVRPLRTSRLSLRPALWTTSTSGKPLHAYRWTTSPLYTNMEFQPVVTNNNKKGTAFGTAVLPGQYRHQVAIELELWPRTNITEEWSKEPDHKIKAAANKQ
jgi:hypothetical protein